MTENIKKIGDRIKELRNISRMTQKIFAEKIGLSESSVSVYESNKYPPEETTIKLICQYFGVTRSWLVDGIGEMYPDGMPEELGKISMPEEKVTDTDMEQIMMLAKKARDEKDKKAARMLMKRIELMLEIAEQEED